MNDLVPLVDRLGGNISKLDVLVNNAGATWGAPLEEFTEANWDKVVDLNLKSIFFLTQKLLPLLRQAASPAGPARVLNISSVHGLMTPQFETYSYSASKAGLIMLTRHLARRLAIENILVNAIAPGSFATKMMAATLAEMGDDILGETPIRRVGRPEEIAGLAIFLSSRASGYTTGAVVPCDGGLAEI
jgi:NAD(P)-dependent dehydrogenase (short-subunit alcohol dehydrogenase family)